jgi:hypothetical protein
LAIEEDTMKSSSDAGEGVWGIEDILAFFHMSRRYLQLLRTGGLFPAPTARQGKSPLWQNEVIMSLYKRDWPVACRRLSERRRKAEAKAGAGVAK